jgi:hypothetical protein
MHNRILEAMNLKQRKHEKADQIYDTQERGQLQALQKAVKNF